MAVKEKESIEIKSFLWELHLVLNDAGLGGDINRRQSNFTENRLKGESIVERLSDDLNIGQDELRNLLNSFGINISGDSPLRVFQEKEKSGFFAVQMNSYSPYIAENGDFYLSFNTNPEGEKELRIAGINNGRIYSALYVKDDETNKFRIGAFDMSLNINEKQKVKGLEDFCEQRLYFSSVTNPDKNAGFVSVQMKHKIPDHENASLIRFRFEERSDDMISNLFAVVPSYSLNKSNFIPCLRTQNGFLQFNQALDSPQFTINTPIKVVIPARNLGC